MLFIRLAMQRSFFASIALHPIGSLSPWLVSSGSSRRGLSKNPCGGGSSAMLVTRGTRNTLNAVVNRVRKLSKIFVPALKKCRRWRAANELACCGSGSPWRCGRWFWARTSPPRTSGRTRSHSQLLGRGNFPFVQSKASLRVDEKSKIGVNYVERTDEDKNKSHHIDKGTRKVLGSDTLYYEEP